MYFPNSFQKCNHKTSENIFLGRIWIPLHFSSYICIFLKKSPQKKKVKKSAFAKPTNEIFWVSKTTNIQTLRKRVRIIFRYFLLNLYIFVFIFVHIRPLYDSCSCFCSQWNIYFIPCFLDISRVFTKSGVKYHIFLIFLYNLILT